MNKKQNIPCLTGILFLAVAAALPFWAGCAKSEKSPAPEEAAADTCEVPTAVEAYKEDIKTAGASETESGAAMPAVSSDDDFPGPDGRVKVFSAGQSFDKMISSAKVVVIDFNATWCGPCRRLGPYLEKMADSYKPDGVSFFSVDVDDNAELAKELDIPSIPDVRIYVDGKPADKVVGCEPIELMDKIDTALKGSQTNP